MSVRRRDFITLLGGAGMALPLAARAQQSAVPTIGFLGPASAADHAPYVEGFRQGLSAAGFVEGRNVAVEYRWADNQLDRLPALAAELVARRVAVIATGSATAAALAAKAATSSIPIVFAIGADPVKFGLVASMNRPGGNITGVSFLANTLIAKQLQMLQGLLPASRVIGVLINPGNPNAVSDSMQAEAAATSLRLKVHVVHTVAERDFDAAFDDLRRAQASSVLVFPDVLRQQSDRCVSRSRYLCRSHSERRKALRPARDTGEQIRAGDQSQDRQDTWSHHSAKRARHRRRGDRVNQGRVRFWIGSDEPYTGGGTTCRFTAGSSQPKPSAHSG